MRALHTERTQHVRSGRTAEMATPRPEEANGSPDPYELDRYADDGGRNLD